ncbi:MAG: hypothetical protein H6660_14690 [Ardenticatenaceae bacterium]|nr:hypothetical protein [Ardenticatenaceae bacterium]
MDSLTRYKRKIHSGKLTVFSQILSAIISLVIGLGILKLLLVWIETWNLPLSSDNQEGLRFIGFMSVFGLLIMIGVVTAMQFENALDAEAVFKLSLRAAFWAGVFLGAWAVLFLFIAEPSWPLFLTEVVFLLSLFGSYGVIVGAVQAARLNIERFDPDKQRWLMTNAASLQAAKLGILPYREQVLVIWQQIFAFGLLIFSILILIFSINYGDELISLVFGMGMIVLSLFLLVRMREFATDSQFITIEGTVSKSTKVYRTVTYILTCQSVDFTAHENMWFSIVAGRTYRLWYSQVNKRVVAFEDLTPRRNSGPTIETLKAWERAKQDPDSGWAAIAGLFGLATAVLTLFFWRRRR